MHELGHNGGSKAQAGAPVLVPCVHGSLQHPASIIPGAGEGAGDDGEDDDSGSGVGELLGWLMAAIYMGGRVPQIYLNVCSQLLPGSSQECRAARLRAFLFAPHSALPTKSLDTPNLSGRGVTFGKACPTPDGAQVTYSSLGSCFSASFDCLGVLAVCFFACAEVADPEGHSGGEAPCALT